VKPPRISVAREFTGDAVGDRAQRVGQLAAQTLNANPFLAGRLLTRDPTSSNAVAFSGIPFTAGTTRYIPHGLGRKCIGYVEVNPTDINTVRVNLRSVTFATGFSSATHVALNPTNTGSVFLYVF